MVRPNDSSKRGRDAQDRFDDLFAEATQLDTCGRMAFLKALAEREPTTAREIAALLRFHRNDEFLAPNPLGAELRAALQEDARPSPLAAGTRVADFTVLRLLGSGGGSTVYEAEQDSPRRSVALKVMRSDILNERAALRRFRDEAAVLARLRHPDIAQVYAFGTARIGDAGETPFLAVEFVPHARTIAEWARDSNASLRDRVRLVARVCDAVAHGHARGILHRDLKPANILIDGDGRPRVIDFGIARILDRSDFDTGPADVATTAGMWIGTPAYMSPEQFEGDPRDLDVRSDVYSMGVVLYEIILGQRPIEMPAWPTLEATIRARGTTPARPRSLNPRVDRDLETIMLVALGKDRQDRHESMIALRDDLLAWADRRPIASRRPSLLRRMTLAARRNPPAAIAVAAALVSASVGIAATIRFAEKAESERDAAEASLRLFARMLDTPVAERDGERTRFADVLAHVATSLDQEAGTPPLVEGRVRQLIGRGFDSIGLIPEARSQFDRSVGVLRGVAPESPTLAAAMADAIGPLYDEDLYDEAASLGREALSIQLRTIGARHADTANTLNELGVIELTRGHPQDALPLLLEAYRTRHDVLGERAVDTGTSLSNLGVAFFRMGEAELGERLIETSIDWARMTSAPAQNLANRIRVLALCRAKAGDLDRAIELVDESLAILLASYPAEHPSVIGTHRRRSEFLCAADRTDEALRSAREGLRLARLTFPESSPIVANAAELLREMEWRAAPTRE
jgi:tRNA A-37 threonylcarbamoyl transferase component Bud32/tetratricopeptide (TPR) repeat protein